MSGTVKLTVPLKDLQKAEKHIAELKIRERKLRDALSYAMDYMDSEQQRDFKTELWPELFTGDEA